MSRAHRDFQSHANRRVRAYCYYKKADAAYEMVADLVAKGVPIDGVGMQMHTRSREEDPPVPEFVANVERYLAQ